VRCARATVAGGEDDAALAAPAIRVMSLPPVVAEIARLGSAGVAGLCAFANRPGTLVR
jgi:hypothetical protein